MRFLQWLVPGYFAPVRKCRHCGRQWFKSCMFHYFGYGYFCDEQEFIEFWCDQF
jgi:hypothetical protein